MSELTEPPAPSEPPAILLLSAAPELFDIRSYSDSCGLNVSATAATASEGLHLLRENTYDGILTDAVLPDMDLPAFMEQLRSQKIDLPVVVVTSPEEEQMAATAIRHGAIDYIPKNHLTPFRVCHSMRNAICLHQEEKKRKRTEEHLKALQYQLEFVITNSPLNAWSCDSTGAITYLNGEVFAKLGIDAEKAIGSFYATVFKDYPLIVARFDKAMAGEKVESLAETNGSYFKACYVPVRNKQGMISGITGFAYDVTDQVNYEQQLTKAKELAEEALRVKELFLANISHEIRTPINGILGLSKILQKTRLDQDQQRYLNAIQRSSNNLMLILNDLLDFAKITARKIEFEHVLFNLPELVQETLDLLEAEAKSRGNTVAVTLAPTVPELMTGDSLRLKQILLNLLGNAVKFTRNGQIRLSTRLLSQTDTEAIVEFKVEDTGIGIPLEHLQTIFESFNQGNTEITRKYGGTGLGLSITKNLVELQGGQIQVQSKPEKGSTFTFSLPFKIFKLMDNNEKEKDQKALSQDQPFGQMRILLAEENEINQMLVNTVLEEWGCITDTVGNGKEVLTKIKTNKYDLVLMDMQMPELDGYEAIIKIRQSGAHYAKIPIIALTAHATTAEVEKCLSAGADGYLAKPFEPEELHENIIRLTTEYRAHSK